MMHHSNLIMWKPEVLPYLLSCKIPDTHNNVPSFVSLVEDDCENPSNLLVVVYNQKLKEERKKKFAVCVKGHAFPEIDMSKKLTEWIEVTLALGAHPIIYYFHNHPNTIKVRSKISSIRTKVFQGCGDFHTDTFNESI